MSVPLVSVVVPVYNGERFLAETLASALGQDYPRVEVIVVDDGSTDRTAEIAAAHPVKLLRQPNQGVAHARNAGVAASSGDLIAFLDADDLWVPHKLSRQAAALAEEPDVGFVLARMQPVLEPGAAPPAWLPPEAFAEPINAPIPSALMVRRDVFERVGGFDPAYRNACDTDWLVRARDAGVEWRRLDETLLQYRIHGANETNAQDRVMRELLTVFRRSVQRRPLVSVIITVRNNAPFLGAAIESVLRGDYRRHEIIVVDNESDDGSGDVASRYPVRYVRQRNLGQAGGRNTGIREAAGELIAFVDSDDEWTPDKLSRQVAHLLAHPELDYVLAHLLPVLERGVERPGWLPPHWLNEGGPGYLPGTLVARRRAFERAGVFDPGYEVTSDTDWFARASDAGLRHEMLPDVLLRWRIHGNNASFRRIELKDELLRTLRASVARKRAAAAGPDGR